MSKFEELLQLAPGKRDEAWEKEFLSTLPETQVRLMAPEAQVGPDGWPYMMLGTGEGASEPILSVLAWLSTRGIGLAVNPDKTTPDFVLTYGMVWNYRERGEFITGHDAGKPKNEKIELANNELLVGPPSEGYFPPYARTIVKQFLMDQGVLAPKVLMVSFDKENYELCFSIESLNSPPEKEHPLIAEALAWFFPAHYTIGLISEKAVPGFVAL